MQDDTNAPRVEFLSTQPGSITLGDSFTISYTVSDLGGSALNRVELWRANDSNGNPADWVEITRNSASGNSDSGFFTDAPPSAGFYWYGIHAVDNAGNWAPEASPVQIEVIPEFRLESVPTEYTGGVIIPREVFPEGKGAFIPLYVPGVRSGSNAIEPDNDWKTVKEIEKTKVEFDWWKLATYDPLAAGTQGPAAAAVVGGYALFQALDKVPSTLKIKITLQEHSSGNLRAIIQVGDPNGKTFARDYAGKALFFSAFWTAEAALSESIAKAFSLQPDNYPLSYYSMALRLDRYHREDEYVAFISLSEASTIVLTPKIYPEDELRIVRIKNVFDVDTIIGLSGNGFVSLTKSSLDEPTSKTILRMLAPGALVTESGLIVQVKSPVELRVYDSRGRVTGLAAGEVKEEIPHSLYDSESKTVVILSPSDSYRYEAVGTSEGTYKLEITSTKEGETSIFTLKDVPTSTKVVHEYTIDWENLAKGEKGVTMKVDSDGDGTFEETRKLGSLGTSFSWIWIIVAGVSGLIGVFVGAFMVWRRTGNKQAA